MATDQTTQYLVHYRSTFQEPSVQKKNESFVKGPALLDLQLLLLLRSSYCGTGLPQTMLATFSSGVAPAVNNH